MDLSFFNKMTVKKCSLCGMIRAKKDLVTLEDNSLICFSCWNKQMKMKIQRDNDSKNI